MNEKIEERENSTVTFSYNLNSAYLKLSFIMTSIKKKQ